MAHVHLQLGVPGAQRNPLRLGFSGFVDHVAPTLNSVSIDKDGEMLAEGFD